MVLLSYTAAGKAQSLATTARAGSQIGQAMVTASTATVGAGAAWANAALVAGFTIAETSANLAAITAQTAGQIASVYASHERRKQEWELQKSLADQEWQIGVQQRSIALQHEQVVLQEGEVARIQANEAKAVAEYLARKFTNAELYDWMSRVLGEVYGYFLQQATAVAQLAQNQLAFERQELPPGFIQADYWQPPSEGSGAGQKTPDRQGLTGSTRLLQDIYKLDQYAFETDKRRLNLAQTFSLAQMAPVEFHDFRQTGVLLFATPMTLFDQGFPGHYLRLIKRVSISVVALIPPNQGIRATLTTSGVSRVITGSDVFQETIIRRDPELVALTSPMNATGVFELDTQADMLLPFEAMGVDTSWEFQMPRAANPFDFNTIADVLVTIEYTALNSFDFRQQVIQRMKPKVSADRVFSLREQFPDEWYQLHNPDDPGAAHAISFETSHADFPPNVENLSIAHIMLHFVRSPDADGSLVWDDREWQTGLSFSKAIPAVYNAIPIEGTISTRRSNGTTWRSMTGPDKPPAGKWTLALPIGANAFFKAGQIQDILFFITYSGQLPAWP